LIKDDNARELVSLNEDQASLINTNLATTATRPPSAPLNLADLDPPPPPSDWLRRKMAKQAAEKAYECEMGKIYPENPQNRINED